MKKALFTALFILLSPLAYCNAQVANLSQISSSTQTAKYFGILMGDGRAANKATASSTPSIAAYYATSTTLASRFPFASTTAVSATSFCLVTCITTFTSGTVTAVTGTYPIISSGGTTPNLTFPATSTLYGTCTGGQVLGWSNITSNIVCTATSSVAGSASLGYVAWGGSLATTQGTTTIASTTPLFAIMGIFSSSTIANPSWIDNLVTNNSTTTGGATTTGFAIVGQKNVVLSTNANGSVVATTSIPVGSNPSAAVGAIAAVNGSAITFMRSDAAPACTTATAVVPGCLAAADFTTFSLKLGSTTDTGIARNMVLVTNATGVITSSSTPVVSAINATSSATSTFAGGIATFDINETGTATSTFVNGIDLTSGCFAIAHTCVSGSAGGDTPGGTGTEFQYRAGASTLGAITGSAYSSTGNWASLGTSTSKLGVLTLGSSTEMQLVFVANNAATNGWGMRNAAGNFLMATTSYAASSTRSGFGAIANGDDGNFFFGYPTTTLDSLLTVQASSSLGSGVGRLMLFLSDPNYFNSAALTYSSKPGSSSGASANLGFNCFINAAGASQIINNNSNCWTWKFDNRDLAGSDSAPMSFHTISRAGTDVNIMQLESSGDIEFGGTAVTAGTCGTSPAIQAPSNAATGAIRLGTTVGASCTINFGTNFATPPRCMTNLNTGNVATTTVLVASTTVSALTVTFSVSNNPSGKVVEWHCFGTQ